MEHPNDETNQKRKNFGNKSQPKECEKAEEIVPSSLRANKSEIKDNMITNLTDGQ